jgi:hypothetical protein
MMGWIKFWSVKLFQQFFDRFRFLQKCQLLVSIQTVLYDIARVYLVFLWRGKTCCTFDCNTYFKPLLAQTFWWYYLRYSIAKKRSTLNSTIPLIVQKPPQKTRFLPRFLHYWRYYLEVLFEVLFFSITYTVNLATITDSIPHCLLCCPCSCSISLSLRLLLPQHPRFCRCCCRWIAPAFTLTVVLAAAVAAMLPPLLLPLPLVVIFLA